MSGLIQRWCYALLFLAIFLALCAGFSPLLVEQFVLPSLLDKIGFADHKFSVSRLGLNGCTLHISGNPQYSSPIISGDLRIDWTPSGLYLRRIDRVSSNGLQINLSNLKKKRPELKTESGDKSNKKFKLPILVEQVDIHNSSLFFKVGDRTEYLPFTFFGQRKGDRELVDPTGAVYFTTNIRVAENEINAALTLMVSENKVVGKIEADIDLEFIASIIPIFPKVVQEFEGNAKVDADTVLQVAPFALENFNANFVSENLLVKRNNMSLRAREDSPAKIIITGSMKEFRVQGTGFGISEPLTSQMDFESQVSHTQNILQWKGFLDVTPVPGPLSQNSLQLIDAKPVRIHYSGSKNNERGSILLTSGLDDKGIENASFIVQYKDIVTEIHNINFDTQVKFGQVNGPGESFMTVSLEGLNTKVKAQKGKANIPKIGLHVEGTISPDPAMTLFSGRLDLEDGSFAVEDKEILLDGVQLELPFAWPLVESAGKGELTVEAIKFGGNELGGITADITQVSESFFINGAFKTTLLPQDKISLQGNLQMPDENKKFADLTFSLDEANVSVNNLTPVLPVMQDMSGGGKVSLLGEVTVSPCGMSGNAEIILNEGNLMLEDGETALEDIQLDLQFQEFPIIKSKPKQQFFIGKIKKKKIVLNNLKTWFEIESPESLFIERISGNWSNGRVFTSSFRLQKGQDELNLALFGDRLQLSSILSQLNLAEAGGEGKLSGRIPIHYSKGKLYVDDGFLYSTPGEKGVLQIKQSKYLDTTIPADVPHFSPLHFAGAALADFEYNWAKLQIKSEKENLMLQLQVDGKPKDKLPFRFDAAKKIFVRLEDESKAGIDQPVKLDVNFNVPINELLQYKEVIPLFRKF